MESSASMRKRRVGVTARSRRIVGDQATGFPQIDAEMAASLELRTPMGTRGADRDRSADGSMATMARKTTSRSIHELGYSGLRLHEALPHTPPRGKPPETPVPFPWSIQLYARQRICQGFAKPGKRRPPLTDSLPCKERATEMRERGPFGKRAVSCLLLGRQRATQTPRDGTGALRAP